MFSYSVRVGPSASMTTTRRANGPFAGPARPQPPQLQLRLRRRLLVPSHAAGASCEMVSSGPVSLLDGSASQESRARGVETDAAAGGATGVEAPSAGRVTATAHP